MESKADLRRIELGKIFISNFLNSIIATGALPSLHELFHYGVPGMKWGIRKVPQRREARKEPLAKTPEPATIHSSVVRKAIESGQVSSKVNPELQNRHQINHRDYVQGRSYMNGTVEDVQKLVNKLSGTGEPQMDESGKWRSREVVKDSGIIGIAISPHDQSKHDPTNQATIVYSKTGCHIYPKFNKKGT